MKTPSFARPLPVTLRVLLSLGFLAAAIPKFLPGSGWHERFVAWGYPSWFVPLVGALEVLGVIGMWVPRASVASMALLAVVLLEASYANLSHPPVLQAARPVIFLAMLTALFWAQRRAPRVSRGEASTVR